MTASSSLDRDGRQRVRAARRPPAAVPRQQDRSALTTGLAAATVGLAERASSSTWAKVCGALALAAAIVATILLLVGVTNLGIAGYIVAVVGICAAVVPLFGG